MSLLAERELELGRIAHSLGRSRIGRGSVLVIRGESGIGKTSLLEEAVAMAERQGFQSLHGSGSELEHVYGFGVVRRLFTPPLRTASDTERGKLLTGPAQLAAPLLGFGSQEAQAEETLRPVAADPGAVVHGLFWLVANLAGSRPLVISVDDA